MADATIWNDSDMRRSLSTTDMRASPTRSPGQRRRKKDRASGGNFGADDFLLNVDPSAEVVPELEKTELMDKLVQLVEELAKRERYDHTSLRDAVQGLHQKIKPLPTKCVNDNYMNKVLNGITAFMKQHVTPKLDNYIADSIGLDKIDKYEADIVEEAREFWTNNDYEENKARKEKRLKQAAELTQVVYNAYLTYLDKVQVRHQRILGKYVPEIVMPKSEEKMLAAVSALSAFQNAGSILKSPPPASPGSPTGGSPLPAISPGGGKRVGALKGIMAKIKSEGSLPASPLSPPGAGDGGSPALKRGTKGKARRQADNPEGPVKKHYSVQLASVPKVQKYSANIQKWRADVDAKFREMHQDAVNKVDDTKDALEATIQSIKSNEKDQKAAADAMAKDQTKMQSHRAAMRRLLETMKKLQSEMDQRKGVMDNRDAQRDELLDHKKSLEEHLHMYQHWRDLKAALQLVAQEAARSLDQAVRVELRHKDDDLKDTLRTLGKILPAFQKSQKRQEDKLKWLDKSAKDADKNDEERTLAECDKAISELTPIKNNYIKAIDGMNRSIKALEESQKTIDKGDVADTTPSPFPDVTSRRGDGLGDTSGSSFTTPAKKERKSRRDQEERASKADTPSREEKPRKEEKSPKKEEKSPKKEEKSSKKDKKEKKEKKSKSS